tara:strand:- start:530 stop:1039 length:510 start_codon:yes stop_codon:yes gene_type:complete
MISTLFYILFIGTLFDAYKEVNNNFSGNGICPKINYNDTNSFYTEFKDTYKNICISTENEYSIIITQLINKFSIENLILYDLSSSNNLFDFGFVLSCGDLTKKTIYNHELKFKIVEYLEEKSISYRYFYYFLKYLNSAINRVLVMFYFLWTITIYVINYVTIQAFNLVL